MIYRNEIVQPQNSSRKFRILRVIPAQDLCWMLDLQDKKAQPKPTSLSELKQNISEKKWTLIKGVGEPIVLNPSKTAIEQRNNRWAIIQALVDEPDLMYPDSRSKLINRYADTHSCSKQTIYTLLRQYWIRGMTPDALIPDYHRCGNVSGGTNGRGKKPYLTNYSIFQVTSEQTQAIVKFARRVYTKANTMTLADSYQCCLEALYSYKDGEGRLYINPQGERPSRTQYQRIIQKYISKEERIRKSEGDSKFMRDHRPKLGCVEESSLGIADKYEIDATIADVHLVSKVDRRHMIGKPTLYFITDRTSRLIVGFYLGLEWPTWEAAMSAILSLVEPKVELCARYGVEYDPNDWPADGILPKTFVCDRGEMLSQNSNLLVAGLNIAVVNLPSKRPDFKSIVEGRFDLMNQRLAPKVPGYEPSKTFGKRRQKKYDQDGCLTVDELAAIVLKGIITHNRSVIMNYSLSPEQALQGIIPSPINIWNHGLSSRAGLLTRYGYQTVHHSLLPQDKARISRDGILFKGCYYTCPEGVKEGWFSSGTKKTIETTASYDRRLVDEILVQHPTNPHQLVKCTLLKKSQNYKSLSFDEAAFILRLDKQLKAEGANEKLDEVAAFNQFANTIINPAKKETKIRAKGISRCKQLKEKPAVRAEEKQARRQTEALISPVVNSRSESAEIIQMPASTLLTANAVAKLKMEMMNGL